MSKKETIKDLKTTLFGWLYVAILFLVAAAMMHYMTNDDLIRYKNKVEMTGYYERSNYGIDCFIIVLTDEKKNKKSFEISNVMYGDPDSPFDPKYFYHHVHKGDVIHFTFFSDAPKKRPYIYELECEGKVYLSFEGSVRALKENDDLGILVKKVCLACAGIMMIGAPIQYYFAKKKLLKKQKESGESKADSNVIRAIVPGIIKTIYVQPYQKVQKGDIVLIIKTMKMEIPCLAPRDGIIENIYVHVHDGIQKDMVLITIQ